MNRNRILLLKTVFFLSIAMTAAVATKASCSTIKDDATQKSSDVVNLEFDFSITNISVSPSGNTAVVWGFQPIARDPVVFAGSKSKAQWLAVIDLASKKIIHNKNLNTPIVDLVVTDGFLYFALQGKHSIHRWTLDGTLTLTKTMMMGQPYDLQLQPGDQLAVAVSESRPELLLSGVIQKIDLATFRKQTDVSNTFNKLPPILPVNASQIRIQDRIVDAKTGDAICSVARRGLESLVEMRAEWIQPSGINDQVLLWGRTASHTGLRNFSGAEICRWNSVGAGLNLHSPIAFTCRLETVNGRNNSFVEIRELVTGTVVSKVKYHEEKARTNGGFPEAPWLGESKIMKSTKDAILIVDNDRLSIVTIPKSAKQTQTPLHLKYPIVPTKSIVDSFEIPLHLHTDGGTKGTQFELIKNINGVSVSKKGILHVKLPDVWQEYLRGRASGSIQPWRVFDDESMDRLLTQNRVAFKAFSGSKLSPDKFGFMLPIHVGVSDQAGQEDKIFFSVLVEAPRKEVLRQIKAENETRQQRRRR